MTSESDSFDERHTFIQQHNRSQTETNELRESPNTINGQTRTNHQHTVTPLDKSLYENKINILNTVVHKLTGSLQRKDEKIQELKRQFIDVREEMESLIRKEDNVEQNARKLIAHNEILQEQLSMLNWLETHESDHENKLHSAYNEIRRLQQDNQRLNQRLEERIEEQDDYEVNQQQNDEIIQIMDEVQEDRDQLESAHETMERLMEDDRILEKERDRLKGDLLTMKANWKREKDRNHKLESLVEDKDMEIESIQYELEQTIHDKETAQQWAQSVLVELETVKFENHETEDKDRSPQITDDSEIGDSSGSVIEEQSLHVLEARIATDMIKEQRLEIAELQSKCKSLEELNLVMQNTIGELRQREDKRRQRSNGAFDGIKVSHDVLVQPQKTSATQTDDQQSERDIIDELRQQIEALEAELEEMKRLSLKNDILEKDRDLLRAELDNHRVSVLSEYQEEINILKSEINALTDSLHRKDVKMKEIERKFAMMHQELNHKENTLDRMTAEHYALRLHRDRLRTELDEMRQRSENGEVSKSLLNDRIARLHQQNGILINHLQEFQAKIKETKTTVNNIGSEMQMIPEMIDKERQRLTDRVDVTLNEMIIFRKQHAHLRQSGKRELKADDSQLSNNCTVISDDHHS